MSSVQNSEPVNLFNKIENSEDFKLQPDNIVKNDEKNDLKNKITTTSKVTGKRKRKSNDLALHLMTEVFLRITYSLSTCWNKNISVGFLKSHNYDISVIISHGIKKIVLNEFAWISFNQYLNLIECYLNNLVFGKKTRITLANCDIEVDNVKTRGDHFVRFKDVSKHDEKIPLSIEEFKMLVGTVPAINHYISQLKLSEGMVKDYLEETLEKHKDAPLLYNPIDSSIYNRLPQEVFLYKQVTSSESKNLTDENFLNFFVITEGTNATQEHEENLNMMS